MTDVATAGEPFRIGSCLARALSVYFAYFISFNAMGLLVMLPGFLVLTMFFGNLLVGLVPGVMAAEGRFHISPGVALGFLGAFVAVLSVMYLLIAAAACGALQYLQGSNMPASAAVERGLYRIVPLVALAAITAVLVLLGSLLLVVPGIVIALTFCVAVPVQMVERPGIRASFSRSRELTSGARWQLFGLFLIAIGGSVAAVAVVALPFNLLLPEGGPMTLVATMIGGTIQLFTTVFLAVVVAVAYHDLRRAKDGVSTAQLAAAASAR
ncbi:MAG: hypothetical protein ACFCUW_14105 [Kiloniellaceae bacterium]